MSTSDHALLLKIYEVLGACETDYRLFTKMYQKCAIKEYEYMQRP